MENIDFSNLIVVLQWLAGIGGPYVIGQAVALLAENWPKWHELPKLVKFVAPMVASALVAVGATLLLQQTPLLEAVSPWYTIVATAVIGWLGTQKGYMEAKKADYARSAREGV